MNKIIQMDDYSSMENDLSNDPTQFLKMKPKKSILKAKQSSIDEIAQAIRENSEDGQKAHFDEMNILATHHPPGKDYGHMKIDEPKTPYYVQSDGEDDFLSRPRRVSLVGPIDADELSKGIYEASSSLSIKRNTYEPGSGPEEEEDESELTEEQIARKREFEKKRRLHYNEGLALRHAKEKEMDAIDSED